MGPYEDYPEYYEQLGKELPDERQFMTEEELFEDEFMEQVFTGNG